MFVSVAYTEQHRWTGNSIRYKSICPVCGGNDLYVTLDNHRAYCFNCSQPFKLLDVATKKVVYRKLPPRQEVYQTYAEIHRIFRSYVDNAVENFFLERGFPREVIETFEIGFCPAVSFKGDAFQRFLRCGLVRPDGVSYLLRRIIFPYFAEGFLTDLRGRTLTNEQPKYLSLPNNSQARGAIYPFNWDNAMQRVQQTKQLIVTEGELKAMAAQVFGYAACALPGWNIWKQGMILSREWDVVVIFDSQVGKQRDLFYVLRRLHRFIPKMRVGILPLLGEEKTDIDMLLKHPKGVSIFEETVRSALPYSEYSALRR